VKSELSFEDPFRSSIFLNIASLLSKNNSGYRVPLNISFREKSIALGSARGKPKTEKKKGNYAGDFAT